MRLAAACLSKVLVLSRVKELAPIKSDFLPVQFSALTALDTTRSQGASEGANEADGSPKNEMLRLSMATS